MRKIESNIPNAEKKEEEELVDEEKELAYKQILEYFEDAKKNGGDRAIQEIFANMFDSAFKEWGKGGLKPEEVSSLVLAEIHSKSASEVAGREIVRPVFIFRNVSELQNFSVKLQGKEGASSRGLVISGTLYPEDQLIHKTGLIVSMDANDFLSHEVRHSADCNYDNRIGADKLLAELFAYYQKAIVEANLKGYRHLENPEDGPWQRLARESTIDYERRSDEIGVPEGEYIKLGQRAADAARRIAEKFGHIEAQRAIMKSKTIEDLCNYEKE